jgi:hypothetical protein
MVTPQMPTGGLIGQAIFHHQTHGQRDHPVGIVGLGPGHVRHVGVEVLAAVSAVMLRITQMDLAWPASNPVPQVAQHTGDQSISGARLATVGTQATFEIPAAFNDLRLGEILGVGNPFGGVRQILSRTRHGKSLLTKLLLADKLRDLRRLVMINSPVLLLQTRFFPPIRPRSRMRNHNASRASVIW